MSDDDFEESSDNAQQPVVIKSGRRAKIPVVIPHPRDHTAKPKVKYNRVGLNLNPLGFKPPESDDEDTEDYPLDEACAADESKSAKIEDAVSVKKVPNNDAEVNNNAMKKAVTGSDIEPEA